MTISPLTTPATSSGGGSWIDSISDWAVSMMETIGAPGAGLAIALENLFPPLPSEVILPLAGFTASRGSFTLFEAIFWTTAGSVIGATVLYLLGAWLGRDRMRSIVSRVPLVNLEDVDRVEDWFNLHGYRAVFFGRMIPLFRSLVSIPAGIERMTVWKFLVLTTAGSLIWNCVFVMAGFYLGENWQVVQAYADVFQKIVIAAVVLFVGYFVVSRIVRIRRKGANRDTA
ncbi:DedA family protein [Arthrobacter sp. H20]|uniref:DedA family protein n=1 Tax=Arthrobacter sp. H20 TaxID=1267981 RepID=UPI000478DC64|nr:DedA family protein [Arthrobacter sp. H20]